MAVYLTENWTVGVRPKRYNFRGRERGTLHCFWLWSFKSLVLPLS